MIAAHQISLSNIKTNYFLKKELQDFCKKNKIASRGSKTDLINFIEYYLKTGKTPVTIPLKRKTSKLKHSEIKPDLIIPDDYSNNEIHRKYFSKIIGKKFKFNVPFMEWLKKNKGKKTYHDAAEQCRHIEKNKKQGIPFPIQKQFEYNQFTRDFFADNPAKTLNECIACWNFKKTVPGNHKYEKSDLKILK